MHTDIRVDFLYLTEILSIAVLHFQCGWGALVQCPWSGFSLWQRHSNLVVYKWM